MIILQLQPPRRPRMPPASKLPVHLTDRSVSAATSPLRNYQRRVAAGQLRADPVQIRALRQLNIWQRRAAGNPSWRDRLGRIVRLKKRRPAARGVYLYGGVGSGKTMLMDLFAQSLPPELVWRVHFHRFMQWAHTEKNAMPNARDPLAAVAAKLAQQYRALCLDEFIVTDITDAMILSRLLHELFARDLIFITTSNTQPRELYKDGLQRARFLPAIELLQNHLQIVRVDGGHDYRADYLQLAELYYAPHDARARRGLRRIFIRLEGLSADMHMDIGAADTPARVKLNDREVTARLVGRETVWFDFCALCETPRAARDYLELAKRFRNVIVADIPPLDADRDAAARRFIELVDALYDRGVNLLVSAALPATELYRGTRLAAPFQRTASRLREMCSQEYLARAHLP